MHEQNASSLFGKGKLNYLKKKNITDNRELPSS